MNRFIFTFTLIVSSIVCLAQSGYRGKTWYVDYTLGTSIALYDFLEGSELFPSINTSHEVSLHKVYSRKHEIAPFISFYKSNLYSSGNPMTLNNRTIGLNFRFYVSRRWSVAPLGSYFDLKPFYSMSDLSSTYKDENNRLRQANLYQVATPGFAFAFGRQAILFDFITFKFGAQLSLPFDIVGPLISELAEIPDPFSNTNQGNELIFDARLNRFRTTAFEIRIGIGLLPF